MKSAHPFIPVKSLLFCGLFALLATACSKEEVVAPAQPVGMEKSGQGGDSQPETITGSITDGTVDNSNPKAGGISDDGDDLGDNEKGRRKGR